MPDQFAAKTGRRSAPPPGLLKRLDGRIKLVLLIAACFVTQYLPAAWLPLWLAALALLFAAREMRTSGVAGMLRGGVTFTLFWLVFKTAADLAWGAPWPGALWDGLPLAGRLFALTLIGMGYVGLSSPMETGRAAAWFLRPMLGKRAWKPALAVCLTAWFLPITLRLAGEVSSSIRARGLKLPWRKKVFLVIGTSLRILEHQADELAVGLASRRMDDHRTWNNA